MNVGYSYWGFLGDVKLDTNGDMLSTPDGNAFYSWCIIRGLQERGAAVYQMMPDRDRPAYKKYGIQNMFSRFCQLDRITAYTGMIKTLYENVDDWSIISGNDLKQIWLDNGLNELDVVLHEWRMLIPGRNDGRGKEFQPDYYIQEALIEFCIEHKISLIIFDLDYKITKEEYIGLFNRFPLVHLFELGHKWDGMPNCQHVEIPFKIEEVRKGIKPLREMVFKTDLVYIGNRYERDEYIDKYIPEDVVTTFYGNWLQSGYNDCVERWQHIHFGHRAQTSEIPTLYDTSVCTILLAKDEYYKYGFMTARILETLYYGCIPLFPIEYGVDIIKRYAGDKADILTVQNKEDVSKAVKCFVNDVSLRNETIQYLRGRLGFMDIQYFVNEVFNIGRGYL